MFIRIHRIGGINFRIQSNFEIPWVDRSHFRSFISDSVIPEVDICLRLLDVNDPLLDLIDQEKLTLLSKYFRVNPTSTLLRSHLVQTQIFDVMDHIQNVWVEITNHYIEIIDFDQHILTLFISAESIADFSNIRLGLDLYHNFLVDFNETMIHCAGIIVRDSAGLFLAPDGGGKTTFVNLAPDHHKLILNDDQVVVEQNHKVFIAHSTPWGLITDGPNSAKVGTIFLLQKADHFDICQISQRKVLESIWNDHQNYLNYLPKSKRTYAFDMIYQLSRAAPIYQINFSKDYVDWDAIEKAMIK
jgi:hypothetical protein